MEPLVTTLLTYNLGVQALEERDYKTAVERFSSVLEADPGNTNVREYLARAHFHRAALTGDDSHLPSDALR